MHLLLPPSETKNAGGRGRPLSGRAPHPTLAAARADVLAALAELLDGDRATAARALALPPKTVDSALDADRAVVTSRTTPALTRYAGTVYDGLDYAGLAPAAQRYAERCVLVFSGLFGVVRGNESIPDYRVPAKAVLPGIGTVGTFWRRALDDILPGMVRRGLVVDLRSTDYSAMWRPPRDLADRVITVRVLSPLPQGGLGVVSYASKLGKGRLAAELISRAAGGDVAGSPDDVAQAWLACGGKDARRTTTGVELIDT